MLPRRCVNARVARKHLPVAVAIGAVVRQRQAVRVAEGRAAVEAAERTRHTHTSQTHFFLQNLGACRRRTPRTRVDPKVPKDASDRDLSDAALRLDLALGVRRRRAPKRRQE